MGAKKTRSRWLMIRLYVLEAPNALREPPRQTTGEPTVLPFLPPLETPVSRPLPIRESSLCSRAASRTRTGDLLFTKELLYQLS